jgi:DNA-binding transcriptional MerR regulator
MSSQATLSISAVSKRTGIPISTLRFYERELASLFHIRKTAGGHRRYGDGDVDRFVTVRRLTEAEGLGLAEVRRAVLSRGENEVLREQIDWLLEAQAAAAGAMEALARRIAELEARVAALETGPPRRRRWLMGREA